MYKKIVCISYFVARYGGVRFVIRIAPSARLIFFFARQLEVDISCAESISLARNDSSRVVIRSLRYLLRVTIRFESHCLLSRGDSDELRMSWIKNLGESILQRKKRGRVTTADAAVQRRWNFIYKARRYRADHVFGLSASSSSYSSRSFLPIVI